MYAIQILDKLHSLGSWKKQSYKWFIGISGLLLSGFQCNAVGREAIEGLRFLASLPLAGAGRKKTQPFNCFHSRLFSTYHMYICWFHLLGITLYKTFTGWRAEWVPGDNVHRWPKKVVLGSVNSPPRQEAGSRNLEQTFLANSVGLSTGNGINLGVWPMTPKTCSYMVF